MTTPTLEAAAQAALDWFRWFNNDEIPCPAKSVDIQHGLTKSLADRTEFYTVRELCDPIVLNHAATPEEIVENETTIMARMADRTEECEWAYDNDDFWQTSCGEAYTFIEGTPDENGVRFCHGCGKPVKSNEVDDE